ncbi:MAG: type II secretion system F family protein [Candidatus Aenigmarchaeota archaeon]|nr:type II secretion system F family protein [Candidatus Aenigmarchaeota archaeon]
MLYRFFPKSYRNKISEMIIMSGMETTAEKYINKSLIISIIMALAIAFFSQPYSMVILPCVFVAVFLFMNAWLILAIDKRKGFVESILPDALELMAANIKAGFIPSKALILSARSEFGPLSEAIKKCGKDIMTGKTLSESMAKIPKFIKSDLLEKSLRLIAEGAESGGQLVALLEENAIDIRRKQAIQKEVKANIIMYGIFIVFAGVLGAPVLYALSIYLITTLSSIGASGTIPESMPSNMPFFRFGTTISPDFLLVFSVVAILITTFFSGIIIGLISSGKEKEGIKYFPIFMVVALIIFFGARIMISTMFAGFKPI